MRAISNPVSSAYVILTDSADPSSIFTTDLGNGRIAACVFSQMHYALQFGKNAHGLAGVHITPLDVKMLRRALESRRSDGVTHVLFDPSAGSGASLADGIDEFISLLKD